MAIFISSSPTLHVRQLTNLRHVYNETGVFAFRLDWRGLEPHSDTVELFDNTLYIFKDGSLRHLVFLLFNSPLRVSLA